MGRRSRWIPQIDGQFTIVFWNRSAGRIDRKQVRLITLDESKRSDPHGKLPWSGELRRINPKYAWHRLRRVCLQDGQYRGNHQPPPSPTSPNLHLATTAKDL